jgi:hypothetical protein
MAALFQFGCLKMKTKSPQRPGLDLSLNHKGGLVDFEYAYRFFERLRLVQDKPALSAQQSCE